ncbi:MAG: ADP-forming succinate--CoA ligase subunit beta [Candidatus Omnitrophica bacterium]|nr:ADP-forming succinate--CoA ligase subunit beta [Candidatus Omnitrophota bacterium]
MNIHEYQAKTLFQHYGIPVSENGVARTPEKAFFLAQAIQKPGISFVVKAQIHAGGRGKAGGVRIVRTPEEVRSVSEALLGQKLVTPQTGKDGRVVNRCLIEHATEIEKEYYAGLLLDRSSGELCLVTSSSGGMAIEAIAEKHPEKIIKHLFSVKERLSEEKALEVASTLSGDENEKKAIARILIAMVKIFLELDASLIEINPLGRTKTGEVIAVDAKIQFDDNALYRHPEIEALRDASQEDPREKEAQDQGLSYVGLEGNIGCIVNGAGLAMATMDMIRLAGGEPANFLDVGGNATKDQVKAAFEIILKDPHVKVILVNIFGGILHCDVVAAGILEAAEEIQVKVPLVVRLEGTRAGEGRDILGKSSLRIQTASSFQEAAEKAVKAL